MPDLHVDPLLYCRAQDLLTMYDDSPQLVRRDELADLVRAMLTHPHKSCVADTSASDRHPAGAPPQHRIPAGVVPRSAPV